MRTPSRLSLLLPFLLVPLLATSETRRVDFEDSGLAPGEVYDGSDEAGGFVSGADSVFFCNYSIPDWSYWEGFALSRVSDTNTAGLANQFAVWTPGTDAEGGGTYAIGYCGYYGATEITLPCERAIVRQLRVDNATYTALSMRDGDSFAKKFGGRDGTDPDWCMLTITGKDAAGNAVGAVEVMLADYRFDDPADDYILGAWTTVDLTPLGDKVATLTFAITSSDVGPYGMNTPAYFAIDDLDYIPVRSGLDATFDNIGLAGSYEPADGNGFHDLEVHFGNTFTDWGYGSTSWDGFTRSSVCDTNTPGFLNQYAVWTPGRDLSTNGNYAVCYDAGAWGGGNVITFPRQAYVNGFYVANTTYAALAMRNGEYPARAFTASDSLTLTVSAADADGNDLGSIDVALAEGQDIIADWTWVDLTEFGPAVKTLSFSMTTTDVGDWGANTPLYFAMDNLSYTYSFSGGSRNVNGNDTDAPIPGFVGGDGLGDSEHGVANPAFAGWATTAVDYSPAPGVATDDQFTHNNWAQPEKALGPAKGDNFDIVSLGDLDSEQIATDVPPGSITLSFATPITDKEGPDFAVFENGFFLSGSDCYVSAELGYVEVSSDGTHFTRFPATSLGLELETSRGRAYASLDARGIHNLCGKHVNAYGDSWGTPFDLSELATHADVVNGTLDLSAVTHVRIIDIPGDGSFHDDCDPAHGIEDQWVTWSSGGVDLEAVGVLNSSAASRIDLLVTGPGDVSPMGCPSYVSIVHGGDVTFTVTPSNGCMVASVTLDGVEQTLADGTITLENLQADHVLAVAFAEADGMTSEGVPYSWLLSNGLMDAASIAAAGSIEAAAEIAGAEDGDGDAQSNTVEFFAGTDPSDSADSFRIIGIDVGAQGAVTITWLGGATGSAAPFEVLVGTNLASSAIETNVVPARAASGTNTWTHTPADTLPRFYSIRVGADGRE